MKSLGWREFSLEKNVIGYNKETPFLKRSIIKIPRAPLELDYKKIDQIATKHKALFVKIEPNVTVSEKQTVTIPKLLKENGYIRDDFPVYQTKTILVDLTIPEEKFLKSLRSETRHHLRKAWKQNLKIKIITNNKSSDAKKAFESFYTLFEECAKERKFFSPFKSQMEFLWENFGAQATIMLVYEKESQQLLSGAFILVHENIAYYKYGASTYYGRNQYGSYFLFWEMFAWARQKKLQSFDLEGIYDPRYHRTNKYKGFTQFKRGWSKEEYTYLGSFTKYYSWPLRFLAKFGITT